MEIGQLKTVHAWVRKAAISEVLFVSALVMPGYLLLYDFAFKQLNQEWREAGLVIAFIVYVAGVVWMKASQSKDERNFRDLQIIRNRIEDLGLQYMAFDTLQDLDKSYSENRIRELVMTFPNELRLGTLAGNRKGVKILNPARESGE